VVPYDHSKQAGGEHNTNLVEFMLMILYKSQMTSESKLANTPLRTLEITFYALMVSSHYVEASLPLFLVIPNKKGIFKNIRIRGGYKLKTKTKNSVSNSLKKKSISPLCRKYE
jgi:hypothetical protein